MIRYLLDTDTVTFWLQGHTAVAAAFAARKPDEIGLPFITTEEIWDGWMPPFAPPKRRNEPLTPSLNSSRP